MVKLEGFKIYRGAFWGRKGFRKIYSLKVGEGELRLKTIGLTQGIGEEGCLTSQFLNFKRIR